MILKTDNELYDIAIGIKAGTIFTDRHLKNEQDLYRTFMPLALMEEEQIKDLNLSNIGMIYEHIKKAAPLSVNGFPTFFSFQMLTIDETKRCISFLNKLDIIPSNTPEISEQEIK